MTTTKLCDIVYVGGKNEGPGNIVAEFHCLTHDVYWLSESMYAPLRCYKAQMKYIAKPETWFDVGTPSELIDDYRPGINSGLFLGLRNGNPDEEVCSFDEFEESI